MLKNKRILLSLLCGLLIVIGVAIGVWATLGQDSTKDSTIILKQISSGGLCAGPDTTGHVCSGEKILYSDGQYADQKLNETQ